MAKPRILIDIFLRFLTLGCISFGGPIAHIGYFQKVFVERLQWLTQEDYLKFVAASQFLPGPGSSQVGFAIGLHRGGFTGGLAAFLGFTLPSFCIMLGLAHYMQSAATAGWLAHVIQGLMLFAVVIVADAVLSMAKQFCQSVYTRSIALISALILLSFSTTYLQILVLCSAGLLGFYSHQYFVTSVKSVNFIGNKKNANIALLLFFILFILSALIHYLYDFLDVPFINLAANFYQSGSLVFGGGHVVLPLLQQNIGSTLSSDQFLLGYSAAQGVPGPMFTLATYLGAQVIPTSPFLGATVATLSIFLPGLLLMYALHQRWAMLSARPSISGAVAAINAGVVGLLFSAWINPILSHTVNYISDGVLVIFLLISLRFLRLPIPFLVVITVVYAFIYL